MITEELRKVITDAGLTPDDTDLTQLSTAIQSMIDAQSGNYALDTGAADAYVIALDPVITAYTDGMVVRFKVLNANATATPTLDAGGGAVTIVNDQGGAVAAGDMPAGSIITAVYDAASSKWMITTSVPSQALSQAVADSLYELKRTALQDLSASRAINTIYQNTKSHTIFLSISMSMPSANTATLYVDSVNPPAVAVGSMSNSNGSQVTGNICVPIPPFAYYKMQASSATIIQWTEEVLP